MDVLTHLLVPYAAALLALGFWKRGHEGDRAKAAIAAVFGIAGASPDIDGLLVPLTFHYEALYFLQHRGFSHTLIGAPLFALFVTGVLVGLARVWPRRLGLFAWRRAFIPAAILGSWTHLVLDAVTLAGVPAFWPWSFERVSLQLFGWIVDFLFPVAAVVLILHVAGRLSHRHFIVAGVVVVTILVVIAGVRLAMMPPGLEDGVHVYPRSSALEWIVLTPHANGSWLGEIYKQGERQNPIWFEHRVPEGSTEAVERARGTHGYRGFLMGSYGPEVVRAEMDGEGWNVTFYDVAQRYEALNEPRWTPTDPHDAWGLVIFRVTPERVEFVHRGW